jgi:hypothetical protein
MVPGEETTMASWKEVSAAHPRLAEAVRARFDAYKHKTMATLRKDGSPRISGMEASFSDGELWLGMTEVVLTSLGGDPPDHLVIESWQQGKGYRRVERR